MRSLIAAAHLLLEAGLRPGEAADGDTATMARQAPQGGSPRGETSPVANRLWKRYEHDDPKSDDGGRFLAALALSDRHPRRQRSQ